MNTPSYIVSDGGKISFPESYSRDHSNLLIEMLEKILELNPAGAIVNEKLFAEIEEEELIYVLGHFYIQVKNVMKPFCPFYLHKYLLDSDYILCDTEEECDKKLLELNYKRKKHG